jgi:hypothetical protein
MWRPTGDGRGAGLWYLISSQADGRYVGRTIHSNNTTLGNPGPHGIPECR